MAVFVNTHNINLRHNSGEMKNLSRQISHVAVYENEKWLDDTCVGGEPGCKGRQDPIDRAHQYAA